MEINIFPHLSGARSMNRYFIGLTNTLQNQHRVVVYSFIENYSTINLWKKYIGYLKKARNAGSGYNLILSERFSFLLLTLRRNKTVVICHDLVTLLNPHASWIQKQWYKILVRWMSGAKAIVCISESTRNDLLKFFPDIKIDKIKIVYNGIEKFWSDEVPVSEPCMMKANSGKKFFLMVGTDAWNKNFNTAISALQDFHQPDFLLIKIGELSDSSRAALERAGLNMQIVHFNQVSDSDLKWFYKNAEALIFPSFHEGFGWPVIEAMASGCPVIASDRSSVPEVGGTAALYFDPYNPNMLYEKMLTVLNNSAQRDKMIIEGKEQAKKFNWEYTAKQIVRLFEER